MPPLIRRRPLLERIKERLDPYDFLLWISEELNEDAYDEILNAWATPFGLVCNLVFILARGANSKDAIDAADDVFGDRSRSGWSWFSWLAALLVQLLTVLCLVNTLYTFFRKRHYRLFEQPVDVAPNTPAAHRVRVDDPPASSSPWLYLKQTISRVTTARHEPDPEREVWEVSIWDAKASSLTLFTLFSPGHLLVYYALLPASASDPRPSITIILVITLAIVLSVQLGYMKAAFTQQAKDRALIQGEVLTEYNTKFVHPSVNKLMRDVATQTRDSVLSPPGTRTREVDVYTPTIALHRSFSTNPNPNYAKLYTPEKVEETPSRRSIAATPMGRHMLTQTPSTMAPRGTPPTYPSEAGNSYLGNHVDTPEPRHVYIDPLVGATSEKDARRRLIQHQLEYDRLTASSGRSSLAATSNRRRQTGRF